MGTSGELFVSLPTGCRICYQTFGNPSDTAILVIDGHGQSMDQKSSILVRLLSSSDHPHFLINFDPRDTGRSTSFPKLPHGRPAYTLSNMADDVVGLIKHLRLERVHVVGRSMGGPISWLVAGRLSNVVKSLALVSTSPVGLAPSAADNLPPPKNMLQDLFTDSFVTTDDLGDHEGWINLYTALDLSVATQPPTEEEKAESRSMSENAYRRERESGTIWTKSNHSVVSGGRWPREALKRVSCPTVVIHMADDQLFPIEYSEALRDDVEGEKLVVIEDCGHELPLRARQPLADAILANVRKGEQVKANGN